MSTLISKVAPPIVSALRTKVPSKEESVKVCMLTAPETSIMEN
jgi:hypothetical protein